MKRILSTLSFIFALAVTTAFGQGSISGKIIDKENGEDIIGGTVYIASAEKGAATDIYGKYMIKGLAAGYYTVAVNYVGYKQQVIEGVEVKDGEVTELNVGLAADVSELEVVVVQATQINNNQTALLSMQRKALAVQDGISVGEIKKMGVSNAAESMKYVTGAAVEDGKYMVLRGLGDRYSLTQMNGVTMPSTDPYRNSASLDLVPTDMIDNIVTVKTFTADQPGSFTGGKVDITTKSLPEEFYFNFGISSSFNTASNLKNDFVTDATEGDYDWLGYDDGTRDKPKLLDMYSSYINSSATAQVNAYDEASVEENTTVRQIMDLTARSLDNPYTHKTISSPLNTGVNFSIGNRFDLFGKPLGVNFGMKYDRSFSMLAEGKNGLYTGVGENQPLQLEQNLDLVSSSVNTNIGGLFSMAYQLSPNHEISVMNMYSHDGDVKITEETGEWRSLNRDLFGTQSSMMQLRTLNNSQLSGKHYFDGLADGLKVEWTGGYVYSRLEEPDARFFAYSGTRRTGTNGESSFTYSMPKSEIGALPSNFFRDLTDTQTNFKIDATLDLKQDDWLKMTLKAGGSYSRKEREFDESIYSMEEVPDVIRRADNTLYKNFEDVGSDFSKFFTNNSGFLGSTENSRGETVYLFGNVYADLSNPGNRYSGSEEVTAAYGMGVLEFGPKFKTIVGLRAEQTTMEAQSKAANKGKGSIEELDLLPSLNTIYKLTDKSNLRFAYGRTLARPNMREISPFNMLVGIGKAFEAGNPDLKRTLIDNIDLRYEYFPNPGELLAVSAYYKRFDNPIVRTLLTFTGTMEIKPVNVDAATVYGVEAELRKNFGFLSPDLEDLVFSTNISLIFSESDKDQSEIEAQKKAGFKDIEETRPFQGQSNYIINGALSYNWRRLQWENSFAFNIFGERLAFVTGALTPDVYEQPRPSLNFVSTKGLGDHLKVSFKATNILDMLYKKSYKGSEDAVFSSFRRGTTFSLGLSYRL